MLIDDNRNISVDIELKSIVIYSFLPFYTQHNALTGT